MEGGQLWVWAELCCSVGAVETGREEKRDRLRKCVRRKLKLLAVVGTRGKERDGNPDTNINTG